MTDPNVVAAEELILPEVGRSKNAQIDYIARERKNVIQSLAFQSKKQGKATDQALEPAKALYRRLDLLLRWLEIELQMTAEVKQKSQIDKGLQLMFSTPIYEFPPLYAQRAKELYEKWADEKWGANEILEDEPVDEDGAEGDEGTKEPPAKTRKTSAAKTREEDKDAEVIASLRLPPSDHPIFGVDGIMHGVAIKRGKRRNYILDPRYRKRNCKAYGHNGLEVGSWFPMQIIALFRGAHGSAMGGIAGDKEKGAYSLVVTGQYDKLDHDYGEYLYYSGSNSHDNEDPKRPAPSSAATLTLHASLATGNPVRVLRAASGKSQFRPIYGLRYDGIYRVVSIRHPLNDKNGMYEQFKLQRLDGQLEIQPGRPNPTEIREFEKIGDGVGK